jgi:nucleoside-diphosphate-sugar epimerase
MKRVIVYGGQGGLGQALVAHLKQKGYWIVSGLMNPLLTLILTAMEFKEPYFEKRK